jgi:transposase
MYIEVVANRTSPPATLLRESYREGDKIKKRTLANLSSLSPQQIEGMKLALKGHSLVTPESVFEKISDREHGTVQAVLTTMRRLGFEGLLGREASPERDLVVAMVASRILAPQSKLATHRWLETTTLPEELSLEAIDEDSLYQAMDWLLARQDRIEKKLAKRHLKEGGRVLYDLSSSYFEGQTCPLAKIGYSRDGKKGTLQVNYGLLTDDRGCPVAVSVFEGNTSDSTTLLPAVEKIRTSFGIQQVVIVGDRGMISQKQIASLSAMEGVSWITALKTGAIKSLVATGHVQMGLFDQTNLFELEHEDYPGERLVACKNPELEKLRAHKRQSLLEGTEKELEKIVVMVDNGKLKGKDVIGVRVGRIINKYKMSKHFELTIGDGSLQYQRNRESISEEAVLDGIYIVRTSLPKEQCTAGEAVLAYKKLSGVERAFRSFKTMDLKVRPIYHHLEPRVRAHIFLTMLAYYVEWHMKDAWKELLFSDEHPIQDRDPVAPAQRSRSALAKISTKKTEAGDPAHSFQTLLSALRQVTKSLCRRKDAPEGGGTFTLFTKLGPLHQRAMDLLAAIPAL